MGTTVSYNPDKPLCQGLSIQRHKNIPLQFQIQILRKVTRALPMDFPVTHRARVSAGEPACPPGYLRSRINTAEIPLPYICAQNKKETRSAAFARTVSAVNFFSVYHENRRKMRKQTLVYPSSP